MFFFLHWNNLLRQTSHSTLCRAGLSPGMQTGGSDSGWERTHYFPFNWNQSAHQKNEKKKRHRKARLEARRQCAAMRHGVGEGGRGQRLGAFKAPIIPGRVLRTSL